MLPSTPSPVLTPSTTLHLPGTIARGTDAASGRQRGYTACSCAKCNRGLAFWSPEGSPEAPDHQVTGPFQTEKKRAPSKPTKNRRQSLLSNPQLARNQTKDGTEPL
eukprot:1359974-Rhodomonas_salina.2